MRHIRVRSALALPDGPLQYEAVTQFYAVLGTLGAEGNFPKQTMPITAAQAGYLNCLSAKTRSVAPTPCPHWTRQGCPWCCWQPTRSRAASGTSCTMGRGSRSLPGTAPYHRRTKSLRRQWRTRVQVVATVDADTVRVLGNQLRSVFSHVQYIIAVRVSGAHVADAPRRGNKRWPRITQPRCQSSGTPHAAERCIRDRGRGRWPQRRPWR